jgi:uncharacterized protein
MGPSLDASLAPRLRRLASVRVAGRSVPVARGLRARLLGLAFLDRGRAGPGLLIPRCRSIHTFGMRFPLDVVFIDQSGEVIAHRCNVGSARIVRCRSAAAVLELPAAGGEFASLRS